jgi:hypothetical protein
MHVLRHYRNIETTKKISLFTPHVIFMNMPILLLSHAIERLVNTEIEAGRMPEAINSVFHVLIEHTYSTETINDCRNTYNRLLAYLDEKSAAVFSEATESDFLDHIMKRSHASNKSAQLRRRRRATHILFGISGEDFKLGRQTPNNSFDFKHFSESLAMCEELLEKRKLKAITIRGKLRLLARFFRFLEKSGVDAAAVITVETAHSYLQTFDKFASSTKEAHLYCFGTFQVFRKLGEMQRSLGEAFPANINLRHPSSSIAFHCQRAKADPTGNRSGRSVRQTRLCGSSIGGGFRRPLIRHQAHEIEQHQLGGKLD